MQKKWYLVNIADTFFSDHPQLKGTVYELMRLSSDIVGAITPTLTLTLIYNDSLGKYNQHVSFLNI